MKASNQSMKPTAPLRNKSSLFATTPCRGLCGSWRQADLFPSANTREDATTPDNNFVCLLCQREVREMKEMERALDEYENGRRKMQSLMSTLLPGGIKNP